MMEDQIVCPNCGRVLPSNTMINEAIKGEGSNTQSMNCECGERITYWNMRAQLRDQKTMGWKVRKWFRFLSQSKG